jgi:hypothetical protein
VLSTLMIGSLGNDVAKLHQSLADNGFSCDGDSACEPSIFGPETLGQVKLFQSCNLGPDRRHLEVDGVVGVNTWWALERAGSEPLYEGTDGLLGTLPDMPIQDASNKVAAVALASAWAELRNGVRELPNGSNRGPEIDVYTGLEGQHTYIAGPAWCAYFASWNFAKAPGGSPFGRMSGAQAIVTYCRHNLPGSVLDIRSLDLLPTSDLSSVVRVGDLGVIPTGPVHGHVLQVAAVKDGMIWTVEGNCGNAVRTRKRPIASVRWYVNFDRYATERKI